MKSRLIGHGSGRVVSIAVLFLTLSAPVQQAFAQSSGVLWLGNDDAGSVFKTDTAGARLQELMDTPTTGIAWDGAALFFSNAEGTITERTPDGTVIDTFAITPNIGTEDLAWDSIRRRLWRTVHLGPTLQRIDAGTHALEASFPLDANDPVIGPVGAMGIAYDAGRDLLYVSFCNAGCNDFSQGVVKSFNPDTGAEVAVLFRTTGFATAGLGYDSVTDTLWVGDVAAVRNMTLAGAVLSSFTGPIPGRFIDGLEFIRR